MAISFPTDYLNSSVSCGTLRKQDLIPAFLDALADVDPMAYAQLVLMPFGPVPGYAQDDASSDWWDSEDASFLLESLFDALSDAAPEGFYFGAIEGDGSDFGFWSYVRA